MKADTFGIIAAEFHERVTGRLLDACVAEFARLGVSKKKLCVVRVPGAFELPVTALALARRKNIRAVICLGAVIRGQTFHYELVAQEAARGCMEASLMTGKPVVFEVLAADTVALCEARAKVGDRDNKGASAARVAVTMATLLQQLDRSYA